MTDEPKKDGPTKSKELAKAEVRASLTRSERSTSPTAIIPQDIEQTYRLAQIICAADMAPKAYNRNVESVMVGIMHGMEIGLTPMAALQSIAVINGMPTIWGDGALGLVRSSGLVEDFLETLEGDGDSRVATCTIKRVGQESPIVRKFSWPDAKEAGLAGKAGPWKQYPNRMLQMRARSWALRDGFADVLKGLGIAEEQRDRIPLTQTADGDYIPADRPLRAHYIAKAAEKREAAKTAETVDVGEEEGTGGEEGEKDHPEATEADQPKPRSTRTAASYTLTNWDGEVTDCAHAAAFADQFEKTGIASAPDSQTLNGLWESNQTELERMREDGNDGARFYDELASAMEDKRQDLAPQKEAAKQPAETLV